MGERAPEPRSSHGRGRRLRQQAGQDRLGGAAARGKICRYRNADGGVRVPPIGPTASNGRQVCWIVESLAASTMPNSTTLLSSSRKLQRAWPSGGLEQARAIRRASFSPSKIRGTEGLAGGLQLKTVSSPSSTPCLRTR